jgi:hypothetical protein
VSATVTKPLNPGPPRIPTAKRLRKQNASAGLLESTNFIVACPRCGDRFAVSPEGPFADPDLAARHTTWLLDRFVWDHIQENKHRSSIPLPTDEELIRWTRSNAR